MFALNSFRQRSFKILMWEVKSNQTEWYFIAFIYITHCNKLYLFTYTTFKKFYVFERVYYAEQGCICNFYAVICKNSSILNIY